MRLHALRSDLESGKLLYPQQVVYPEGYLISWKTDICLEIGKVLRGSVHFYLGTLSLDTLVSLYNDKNEANREVIKNLPFNTVTIEFTCNYTNTVYSCILLCEQRGLTKVNNLLPYYTIRLLFKDINSNYWTDSNLEAILCEDLITNDIYFEYMDPFIKLNPMNTRYEEIRNLTEQACEVVINLLLSLACKNITIKNNPAPLKLNKKRVKKGLIPIREYKTLHIDNSRIKYLENNNQRSGRVSPRVHFRRGHIRKLHSGGLVWIQHCLVGTNKAGMIDKEYSITM